MKTQQWMSACQVAAPTDFECLIYQPHPWGRGSGCPAVALRFAAQALPLASEKIGCLILQSSSFPYHSTQFFSCLCASTAQEHLTSSVSANTNQLPCNPLDHGTGELCGRHHKPCRSVQHLFRYPGEIRFLARLWERFAESVCPVQGSQVAS